MSRESSRLNIDEHFHQYSGRKTKLVPFLHDNFPSETKISKIRICIDWHGLKWKRDGKMWAYASRKNLNKHETIPITTLRLWFQFMRKDKMKNIFAKACDSNLKLTNDFAFSVYMLEVYVLTKVKTKILPRFHASYWDFYHTQNGFIIECNYTRNFH